MADSDPSASGPRGRHFDNDVITAEVVERASSQESAAASIEVGVPVRRRKAPIILFALTCVSTFWIGGLYWRHYLPFEPQVGGGVRGSFMAHWDYGLIYMACLLAILLAHEFGHFVATLRHRIPASYPYFLPMPISPLGTLGAVIVMDGRRADRKQMFDIGIAGPLAGLVVAIPLLIFGVQALELSTANENGRYFVESPLIVKLLLQIQKPMGYENGAVIWNGQLNPYFMAGWTGLLVTGLNMMPVSQLDGGHVVYALFGKGARWVARGFMVLVIALIVYDWEHLMIWVVMVALVLLIGTDHPPTRDDRVRLGWVRRTIGYASLSIPVLCFPPRAIVMMLE